MSTSSYDEDQYEDYDVRVEYIFEHCRYWDCDECKKRSQADCDRGIEVAIELLRNGFTVDQLERTHIARIQSRTAQGQ